MLCLLTLFLVLHQVQQFLAMIFEERATHIHKSSRESVMNAVTGRAHFLVGLGRLRQPLPAPFVEHGAALWANRGLWQFVLGLIGVMSRFLDQTVAADWVKASELGFHLMLLFNDINSGQLKSIPFP
jgi:hypothetical protein